MWDIKINWKKNGQPFSNLKRDYKMNLKKNKYFFKITKTRFRHFQT